MRTRDVPDVVRITTPRPFGADVRTDSEVHEEAHPLGLLEEEPQVGRALLDPWPDTELRLMRLETAGGRGGVVSAPHARHRKVATNVSKSEGEGVECWLCRISRNWPNSSAVSPVQNRGPSALTQFWTGLTAQIPLKKSGVSPQSSGWCSTAYNSTFINRWCRQTVDSSKPPPHHNKQTPPPQLASTD
jgi:hypothetical protein